MNRLGGLIILFFPLLGLADVVVPIDAVSRYVNIRMSSDSASEVVGRLKKGDHLALVATTEEWHEVELADGATGFISGDWARILDAPPSSTTAAESSGDNDEVDAPSIADDSDAVTEIAQSTPDTASVAKEATDAHLTTTENDESLLSDRNGFEKDGSEKNSGDVEDETFDLAAEAMSETLNGEPGQSTSDESRTVLDDEIEVPDSIEDALAYRGEPGPPGPPGSANIEGSEGFLTRFTAPTEGGSSQIYDDGNNIGIGTTEPEQRLEVNGNIQIHEQNSSVAGLMITQSDGDTGYIMHNRANTLTIGAGSIDRITIDRDGYVGVGVAQPTQPLEMASGAHVTEGGVWTNSSSRARKENISTLSATEALDTLSGLEPMHFNYKSDQSERYVGFIAEDVPDLVATNGRDGLSSMDIVAVLTKVVQEQQKKIVELEARLNQR